MDLFGFEIKRKDNAANEKSFVAPSQDDAIESIRAGGYYGTYMDLEGVAHTESELIKRYRDIAGMADVDTAVEDIINESIVGDHNDVPVDIVLDKVEASDKIKKLIKTDQPDILNNVSVIIDEAHNIRNETTDNLMLITSLEFAHKVILLTATPVINYLNDLAVLINIIKNKLLVEVVVE